MPSSKHEIERKYLIRMPDVRSLEQTDGVRVLRITQTYLEGETGMTRRVRRIEEYGKVSYILTEKKPFDPITRIETETPLSEEEYNRLVAFADPACAPLSKVRYAIPMGQCCYEIDIYPTSEKIAVLEVELSDPTDRPPFPPFCTLVADVSEDRRFSNHHLSRLLKKDPKSDPFTLLLSQNNAIFDQKNIHIIK